MGEHLRLASDLNRGDLNGALAVALARDGRRDGHVDVEAFDEGLVVEVNGHRTENVVADGVDREARLALVNDEGLPLAALATSGVLMLSCELAE